MIRYFLLICLLLPLVSGHGEVADGEFVSDSGATHHFEVELDSLDGLALPYATVEATFVSANDRQTVLLHPMVSKRFHYAADVTLLGEPYRVDVHIDPPSVMRGLARKDSWTEPYDLSYEFDPRDGYDIEIANESLPDMQVHVFTVRPGPVWFVGKPDAAGHDGIEDSSEQVSDSRRDWMFTFYGFIAGAGLVGFAWWSRRRN